VATRAAGFKRAGWDYQLRYNQGNPYFNPFIQSHPQWKPSTMATGCSTRRPTITSNSSSNNSEAEEEHRQPEAEEVPQPERITISK